MVYSINANGIPFYIGRTCDLVRRRREHLWDKSKTYKANKIRKCVRIGVPVSFVVLHEVISFRKSIELEILEIKKHKDLGIKLTNRTLGGEGSYGATRIFTPTWKLNLKLAKQRQFANGYVVANKGKTLEELVGKTQATAQKLRIGSKITNGRHNGTMRTTKGRSLDQMVGYDKAVILKQQFSDRARITFTGTTQSQSHIDARITSQILTKANWTEEQRNTVKAINTINGAKSIKRHKFVVNEVFSHYGTWKSLSIALNEELGIVVTSVSLSNLYRGNHKFLKCGIETIKIIN